ENGKILANSQVEFIWDGSHLVQEIDHKTDRTFSYIYSHPNSYEPLAQLEFAKDNEKPTGCYYYHNDQIGVPREFTDEEGKVCWYGSYTGWGKLKESYQANDTIHQPFRLQNQYCDQETGLHYNFFRYYEPNIGRFTQLDPIGLAGGENLYRFEGSVQNQIDPLGLFVPVAGYAGYALWGMLFGTAAVVGIQGTIEALESTDSSSSKTNSVTTDVSKCSEEEKKKRCKKWGMGTPAQAQNKVRKQQAPRGIYRIDGPEEYVPYSQWHAHALNNSALNQDGTVHDKHRGYPPFSRDDKDFLFCHGWNI
ncbi:RHS repeat-associated core domain-containing protein, partial [Gallibacterium anatis]|uniref:RHS repeat domain-containing protein n=5 Tax=Gallibacterium anatis TaxID=750 RepID=UPI0030CA0800